MLSGLDEHQLRAQVLGPGGEPAVEELFELGVQGDVAVVVQFADRDPQPVGGADLHDGVDGEVDELALAHAGAGEELDDETDQGVGVGASSDEQLRRGGVVEEPGQRVVLDRSWGKSGALAGASVTPHSMSRWKHSCTEFNRRRTV